MNEILKKITISIIIMIIMAFVLIFLTAIFFNYLNSENECDHKYKMINNDGNKEILLLKYHNNSRTFYVEIGPFVNQNGEAVTGAQVTLSLSVQQYFSMTNQTGLAFIRIPEKIINSTDLSQKYKIEVKEDNYYGLSWEVEIKIRDD